MHIEEMTAQQIAEVLLNREEGLSVFDDTVLADELIERNSNLDMFGRETLVEALKNKDKVNHIISNSICREYGAYVEGGQVLHSDGIATILIVKGVF